MNRRTEGNDPTRDVAGGDPSRSLRMSARRPFGAVGVGAICAFLSVSAPGCVFMRRAPVEVASTDVTANLGQRAETLWSARAADDCPLVFRFLEPDRHNATEESAFVAWCREEEPFRILEHRIGRILTEGELGWVEVDYLAAIRRFPELPPRRTARWEKWRLREGIWYPIPADEVDLYPDSPAVRNAPSEDRLRQRFLESWDARQRRAWSDLYRLVDPEDRAAISETEFADSEGLFDYLGLETQWVEVQGDRGKVHVTYHHKVTDPSLSKLPARSLSITEKWIQRDEQWYRDLQ